MSYLYKIYINDLCTIIKLKANKIIQCQGWLCWAGAAQVETWWGGREAACVDGCGGGRGGWGNEPWGILAKKKAFELNKSEWSKLWIKFHDCCWGGHYPSTGHMVHDDVLHVYGALQFRKLFADLQGGLMSDSSLLSQGLADILCCLSAEHSFSRIFSYDKPVG